MTAKERAVARARSLKSYDLMRAFRAEVAKVAPGVDPLSPAGSATVVQLARTATHDVWESTADLHGINRPSPETVAATIALLESLARSAGDDPFAEF